jgi:hypothetical protein
MSSAQNIGFAWRRAAIIVFPEIDLSSATNALGTWRDNKSLTTFNNIDLSNATDLRQTWYGCSALNSFNNINLGGGTNYLETLRLCTSLDSVNVTAWGTPTSINSIHQNCTNLKYTTIYNCNMTSCIDIDLAFYLTTLSTGNYDQILLSWSAQTVLTNRSFLTSSKYSSAGLVGRNILTGTYTWSITDGGLE